MIRRHFQTGDPLLAQGDKNEAFHFISSGVIQVKHQVPDGRVLDVEKLGPGDTFGELSILTGMASPGNPRGSDIRALATVQGRGSEADHCSQTRADRALCNYITRMRQFLTGFEQSALQPADLLWRIKNFFRFNPEGSIDSGRYLRRDLNEAKSARK